MGKWKLHSGLAQLVEQVAVNHPVAGSSPAAGANLINRVYAVYIASMNPKQKGNIGEAAVSLDLMKRGFAVFTELGDNSPIDLIAERKGRLYKIQVKARKLTAGTVSVQKRSKTKGYVREYSPRDFDICAVYIIETEQIAYISSHELCSGAGVTLRIEYPKNNQRRGINMITEYLDIERIVHD